MDKDKGKASRSGTKPPISISVPKRMVDDIKAGTKVLLHTLAPLGVSGQSHLFRLMILHSKIVDGSLVIDLSKAKDVK